MASLLWLCDCGPVTQPLGAHVLLYVNKRFQWGDNKMAHAQCQAGQGISCLGPAKPLGILLGLSWPLTTDHYFFGL